MTPITSVSIDIVTDEQWIRGVGGGGMKITINDTRLTRFVDERTEEWIEEWSPEYAGSAITSDMWEMITTTTRILDGAPLFEEETVEFMELRSRLILEPVGEETIRVAFRVAPTVSGEYTLRSVPASACGYPVDERAWGNAVLEAGRKLRDELVALGHETPGDEEGFDPLLADLREQLNGR